MSPDRVVAGVILRQSSGSDTVLAVVTRRLRSIFMDLGRENNCVHANPSAGDLPAGGTAEIRSALYVLSGTPGQCARVIAERDGVVLPGI